MRQTLEALLDGDADSLDGGACHVADLDQTAHGAAVCHEVVDDENMIVRTQVLLGHDDL